MAVRQEARAKFEREPPQSIEAERAVLGAMLINPDAVGVVLEILHGKGRDAFYVEAHQHIYDAVVALFRRNTPVDPTTLIDQLGRDGHLEEAGGVSYLSELPSAVSTSANIEYYAKIVLDTALLRRIISTCSGLAGEAYKGEGEVSQLLDRAEQDIFAIAEQRQLNPIYAVKDLVPGAITRIEEQLNSDSHLTGLATGFTRLDEMLSGLQKSDVIILAARPSVGKTALALNIAAHVTAHLGRSALLFSLEMAKEQLVQRLLCMVGRVDSDRLRKGFLAGKEFPKLQEAAGILNKANLFIDETANINSLELRSKARRHMSHHPYDLIIIDYLQLMTGGGRVENRQVEIAEISRGLKGIARQLKVPVLALSQLSREAEKDDTGLPKLSHLRESGAIEQDADVVLMLSRLPAHESEERPDVIRLTVAKQRNGPTGQIELLFNKNIQRFENLMADGSMTEPAGGQAPAPDYDDYDEDFEEDDTPF